MKRRYANVPGAYLPISHLIKVLAAVLGVEVRKRRRILGVGPDLAQQTRVDVAHEHLTDDVEAVS